MDDGLLGLLGGNLEDPKPRIGISTPLLRVNDGVVATGMSIPRNVVPYGSERFPGGTPDSRHADPRHLEYATAELIAPADLPSDAIG
jgi:hypothetical protein